MGLEPKRKETNSMRFFLKLMCQKRTFDSLKKLNNVKFVSVYWLYAPVYRSAYFLSLLYGVAKSFKHQITFVRGYPG